MRAVLGEDEAVAFWMEAQTKLPFRLFYERDGKPAQIVIGWVDDAGVIKAGALFSNFRAGGSVEVHICGRMTRQTIRDVMRLAFDHLKVLHINALPYRSNKVMRKILPRLGFTYNTVFKNQYGPRRGDDAIVFRCDRNSAMKWL